MINLSILLVPGSFAPPELYDGLVNAVTAKGYDIRALDLPTVSPSSAPIEIEPPTMYDDAAYIAGEVERLVNGGKDVIVIAHSYGGIPASESTKGLGKKERKKQGKPGGIVRLAYMTALVPPIGTAAIGIEIDIPEDHRLDQRVDEFGWMYLEPSSLPKAASILFSDIPQEEGEELIKQLARQSFVSFTNELTYAGYGNIPVSFLFCENDLVVPPATQRTAIELIEKVSGRKVDVTKVPTSHVPHVSQPEKVVDWIVDMASSKCT